MKVGIQRLALVTPTEKVQEELATLQMIMMKMQWELMVELVKLLML